MQSCVQSDAMKLVVNEAVEILESLDSGIIRLDPSCRVTYMNPSAERLLGRLCREIAGKTVWDVMPTSVVRMLSEELCRAFRQKTAVSFVENFPDPANLRVQFRCLPCGEGVTMILNEAPPGAGTGSGLSDRRHIHDRQTIRSQKMNSMWPLACGVVHDLKNILTPIILNTELAMEHLSYEDPARVILDDVLGAARLGADLVKQIVSFSRHDAHKKAPVNLLPIVRETLVFLRASLPSTIDIRHRLKEDHAMVMADATQIKQVLMNLAGNAAHAMREHGGLLEVCLSSVGLCEEAAGKISPGLSAGPYVRIEIRDTGHGMDGETKTRIFDPFFTTKSQGEGTGLGLSVVHGIIEDHTGAVTVESEPGRGSTFTVLLPRIRRASLPREASSDHRRGEKERILLIMAEHAILADKQQALSSLGYRLTTMHHPIEALDLFRSCPEDYDLIITEHEMRPMSGLLLIREIRLIRPDIPIILCSAARHLQSTARAESLGIHGHLFAPIHTNELIANIKSLFGKKLL